LISGVIGHGTLTTPTSRAGLGCPQLGGPSYYCEHHQATLDFCGAHARCAGLHGRRCESTTAIGYCTAELGTATPLEPYCNPNQAPGTSFLETPGVVQASWTAGEEVDVAWSVSAPHGGWYRYRLCLDGSDTEDCFRKTPLLFSDGEMWHPQNENEWVTYEDRIIIPMNISCDRCTLSWHWEAHYDGSGSMTNSTEVFIGCADITISPQSTTPSPPSTTPAPTPPNAGGQCCYAAGCSSCNGAGEWCSQARSNCEGSCGGSYCSGASSLAVESSLKRATKHE